MGNKVSRWMRNYDAERRAMKLLSRTDNAPARAPRFESEQQLLRQIAKDPLLDEAISKKDANLLQNLNRVKVVSSIDPAMVRQRQQPTQSHRPLPQRRHFLPVGELGVPEVAAETVPPGRLTLVQFQELLNTKQPQGAGLTSDIVHELLEFYAPLIQRTPEELKQLASAEDAANPSANPNKTDLK